MGSIKNFIASFRRFFESTEGGGQARDAGKLYALWLIILPLLMGLTLGRLAGICLGYGLDKFSGDTGVRDSIIIGGEREGSNVDEKGRGLDKFLSANPFKISPQKPDSVDEAPKPVTPPPEPAVENKLENLIVRGTLPNVGAWIEDNGNLQLLLIGKTYEKYKLASVSYREAVFRKGRERITRQIVYGPVPQKQKNETKPSVASTPRPSVSSSSSAATGNIVAAQPGKQDGEVPSEVVNQLVQNPFDELKRIRMRPNEKAGGLEVQWIQNESILKRLGVQKGDVIKSVNGIPFTNMGDIANSINSLMSSERFDVEVTRGGNPTALRYVVR